MGVSLITQEYRLQTSEQLLPELIASRVEFIRVGGFQRSWDITNIPHRLLSSQAMLDHIRDMALVSSQICIGKFEQGENPNRSQMPQRQGVYCAEIFDTFTDSPIGEIYVVYDNQSVAAIETMSKAFSI